MKGFAARVTSIRNSADNMLVGAGNKRKQRKVMREEFTRLQAHYESISQYLSENADKYPELTKINDLLPRFQQVINDFIKKPTKESFATLTEVSDQVSALGQEYGIRIGEQAPITAADLGDLENQADEVSGDKDLTPIEKLFRRKMIGDIQTEVKQKIIDDFPEPLGSQESLDSMGRAIAKRLGLDPDLIVFHWDTVARTQRIAGYHIRRGKKKHITLNANHWHHQGTTGQANLKDTLVHELGHMAKPPTGGDYKIPKGSTLEVLKRPDVVGQPPANWWSVVYTDPTGREHKGDITAETEAEALKLSRAYHGNRTRRSVHHSAFKTWLSEALTQVMPKTISQHIPLMNDMQVPQEDATLVPQETENATPKSMVTKQFKGKKNPEHEGMEYTGEIGGEQVTLYRDTEQFGTSQWYTIDPFMGENTHTDLTLGTTKTEAIANLEDIARRKQNKTSATTESDVENKEVTPEDEERMAQEVSDGVQQGDEIASAQMTPRKLQFLYETKVEYTPEGIINEAIRKLEQGVRNAQQVRPETLDLRRQERKKRFSEAESRLASTTGQSAIFSAMRQLKGQLPEAAFEFGQELTSSDLDALADKINQHKTLDIKEKINAYGAIQKLISGRTLAPFELNLIHRVFGGDFASIVRKLGANTLTGWRKARYMLANMLNVPRTIMASFDFSAGGRQGVLFAPRHPIIWARSVAAGYGAAWSSEWANAIDLDMRNDKYAQLRGKANLSMTDWRSGLSSKEEGFQTDLLDTKPGWNHDATGFAGFTKELLRLIPRGVKASERAYVITLNKLRVDMFNHYATQWQGTGKSMADYKKLASFINHATGRGTGKWLENNGPILSAAFFSPRLATSRFQVIGDTGFAAFNLATGQVNRDVSRIIAENVVSFIGAGMGVMALAALGGAEVEKDPRSSEFGKIKIGNTRLDVWGGFSQTIRMIAQFLTQQKKSGDKMSTVTRDKVVGELIRTKLSPVAGLGYNILRMKTYFGDDLKDPEVILAEVTSRLTPLVVQDIYDAARFQGWGMAAVVAPLAVHGVGAQTYERRPGQLLSDEKNRLANTTFGKKWEDLGPNSQKILERTNPQLEEMAFTAKQNRQDYSFLERMIQEQVEAGQEVTDTLDPVVQRTMEGLSVQVGGLSRKVGSNLVLNNDRFNEYKRVTGVLLDKVLPTIIANPTFDVADTVTKRQILDEIITRVKKTARTKVVYEATQVDMVDIEEFRKSGRKLQHE